MSLSAGTAATESARGNGRRDPIDELPPTAPRQGWRERLLRRKGLWALLVVLGLIGLGTARAEQLLVVDLSSHLVAITTGFAGTNVLLFGTKEGEGDVVVVVRGPERQEVVRHKARISGVWINSGSLAFANVPSYYHLASSRPLVDIAAPGVLIRHGIGAENLRLVPLNTGGLSPAQVKEYREALFRNERAIGLYADAEGKITFLGHRLFRTDVHIPSNVPTGTYLVEVYLFRGGEVVSAQTTPLVIGKVGVGAEVFRFAHAYSWIYGILAIFVAVSAGWLASVLFKKG